MLIIFEKDEASEREFSYKFLEIYQWYFQDIAQNSSSGNEKSHSCNNGELFSKGETKE